MNICYLQKVKRKLILKRYNYIEAMCVCVCVRVFLKD